MAGQIVKAKVKKDFVIVKNSVAQRHDLSWQALGLLTYILSLPDDWVLYKKSLCSLRESNKRLSTEKAFNELEEKGFIFSVEKRDNYGHFKGYDYIVYNEPPNVDNQQSVTTPNVDYPQSENPQSDYPQSENQHLQKKYSTKKELTKKDNTKEIPSFDEFLKYAKEKKNTANLTAIKLKYEAWVENGWRTGKDKPIKNWKSTLLQTLPYLKEDKIPENTWADGRR